jgi:hypothetical protein
VTFAQLDDHFDDSPKYVDYDAAVMGLLACGITYANRHLTDGVIPRGWPKRRFPRDGEKALAVALRDARWVLREDGNLQIVGFLDHNLSRDEVLEKRRAKAETKQEAGRVGGLRSGEARRSKREAESKQTPSSDEAPAGKHAKQNEPLSSPLLSLSDPTNERENPLTPFEPESCVTRIATLDEPEPLPPGVTATQLGYQRAYETGIARGKQSPYAMPSDQRGFLHTVLTTFARNREGKAIRGDKLTEWIIVQAESFAQQVRGKDAQFYSSFGPKGFLKFMNEAEIEEVNHG